MNSVIDVIYCLYRLSVSRRTLLMHKLNHVQWTVSHKRRCCLEHYGLCSHELWFGKLKWICGKLLKMVCSFYLLLLQLKHGLSSSSINEAHLSDPVRAGARGKRHVSDPSLLFHSRKWLRIKLLWRNSSECWVSRNDFITRLYLML